MKQLRKLSMIAASMFMVCLLTIQHATASDYDRFIFRPLAQKQSFLEKYVLKHFQRPLFDGSYAIVIAVGDYAHLPRLESVRSDAEKITQFLLNTADYDEVVVLKDAEASFDAIRYFMEVYFPEKMRDGRYRFLFYFSGHGTQRQGTNGPIGYLQLQQAKRQFSLHAINMNHIENWAEQFFHATHVLFLIDACFSGLAGIEDKSYETGLDPIDLAQENGRFMITAGGADETSIASLKKWEGSLFTDVVLHGMRGNADTNHDGVITIYELFSYTQAAVSNEAKKSRHSQHPLISNLGSYRDKGQYFFVYQDPGPGPPPLPTRTPTRTPTIRLRNKPQEVSLVEAERLFGVTKTTTFGWVPQEYIDNQFEAQGTVVLDHATGLMWQQSGSEKPMNYREALKYVEDLNRQKFAGYTDWRLPTIPELMSLLEPEEQSNDLHIDPIFDSRQSWCWSTDRVAGSSGSAWFVYFDLGLVYWNGFQGSVYVRCVRYINTIGVADDDEKKHTRTPTIRLRNEPQEVSEAEAERLFGLTKAEFGWVPQEYIDNQFEAQGTVVLDHATGLMWQQSGSDDYMNYESALKYVEKLNRQKFAGYSDWRLPTILELMSLVEPEEQSNGLYIDPIFRIPGRSFTWYWSSDRVAGSSGSAWVVDFSLGNVRWNRFQVYLYVRCVRS